jgi:hypothetical protein
VQEESLGQRGAEAGEPPGAGNGPAVGVEELRPCDGRPRVGPECLQEGLGRASQDLGVLVQQQTEAALSLAQEEGIVFRQAAATVAPDHPDPRKTLRHRLP